MFHRTDLCTEAELRQAEAIAFTLNTPGHAGLIAFYRHTKYGCEHPAGYAGELGLATVTEPLA